MEKFFHLKENGTTVSTEILAGLTTFFAMAYIIVVNPQILSSTGMPWGGVFLATIIAAIIGTLVMGLFANVPYAQAAGMGLNAFFTYTVCFGLGFKWQETLCMVFLCGLINIIITVTKIRKMIIQAIPEVLQNAIGGGIGLFRSEFLYLNTTDYPTEDQQFEAYKQVLSDMDGKEVIIRTLDIGADKQIGYFDLPKEDNPAMGMRALRICLTRPEIFKTQLRALFRASAFGKLGIMFPMVTSVWEVREAKRMCEEVRRELKNEGIPYSEDVQIGIMIETPAAAINSDRLAKEVDFFSIGTNDLTQYTLACDRQNNDLGRFYDPHHLAVLRLIRLVTENAHKNGIWVGICGELGADLTLTETFLAFGVDELSVTPRSVLPLRNAVRMTDTRESSERILSDLDSDYTAR